MHTRWRACARGLLYVGSARIRGQLTRARKRQDQNIPLVAAAWSLTAARSRLKALSAAPWKPDWPAPWSWRRPSWRRMGERNCLAARVVNMIADIMVSGEWRAIQLTVWLLLHDHRQSRREVLGPGWSWQQLTLWLRKLRPCSRALAPSDAALMRVIVDFRHVLQAGRRVRGSCQLQSDQFVHGFNITQPLLP